MRVQGETSTGSPCRFLRAKIEGRQTPPFMNGELCHFLCGFRFFLSGEFLPYLGSDGVGIRSQGSRPARAGPHQPRQRSRERKHSSGSSQVARLGAHPSRSAPRPIQVTTTSSLSSCLSSCGEIIDATMDLPRQISAPCMSMRHYSFEL